MIRIMHILHSFDVGGLETVIANLINRMDAGMFLHSICVFSKRTGALHLINDRNINVFIINRNFKHDPTVIFRLARLLKAEEPDMARTYNWGAVEGIIAAKLAGIKHIVHSEHGFDIDEILIKKKRRVLVRKILLRFCDKVITVSQVLQRWLVETVGIDANKLAYIPNGCDLNRFYPGRDEKIRNILSVKKNEILIGSVGSLKDLKDHGNLIRTFAAVNRYCPDLKLVLIGDGPKRKDLEALAREQDVSNKVVFTGAVVDTAPFYRAMDIFVLPSLSENAPNVLLEAMASGLPIIATDVGDVRYMLDGEQGGIIVKPKDTEAVARGIGYFVKNISAAREKGNFVRNRAEKMYGMNDMVRAYQSAYLTLMKKEGD